MRAEDSVLRKNVLRNACNIQDRQRCVDYPNPFPLCPPLSSSPSFPRVAPPALSSPLHPEMLTQKRGVPFPPPFVHELGPHGSGAPTSPPFCTPSSNLRAKEQVNGRPCGNGKAPLPPPSTSRVTVSPSPARDSPRDYTPTADIPVVESANTPEDAWWDWQAEEDPHVQERVWAAIEALEHTARAGRLVSDRSPSPPQNRCQEPWE
ncbi:hypothetical protein EDB84DRAFT_1572188 [Lactarius hengduanensis]|nr:hypothetical protein EDB84DRAFT_1572188 [Lactarius hengduanensis]